MKREEKIATYMKSIQELDCLLGAEGKYALDETGKMAIISAVLKINLPYFLFVGFYRVVGERMLLIGPYQGDMIVCGTISFEKGVCGVCAREERTLIVDDVNEFPGYIACDNLTRSEIVVPVFKDGKLSAVLDVDGVNIADFDEIDKEYLEKICREHFR